MRNEETFIISNTTNFTLIWSLCAAMGSRGRAAVLGGSWQSCSPLKAAPSWLQEAWPAPLGARTSSGLARRGTGAAATAAASARAGLGSHSTAPALLTSSSYCIKTMQMSCFL